MHKDLNNEQFSKLINIFKNEKTKEAAEDLELFLEEHLAKNPYDTEIWIKLALVVYWAPLYDDLKAAECLKKILKYNPKNVRAILLLVYILDHCMGFDDDLFKQLCDTCTDNEEYMSMIEYVKTSYYFDKDEALYQASFEKSIECCDRFVWNHVKLGQFFLYKKNLEKGYYYLQKGIMNIEYVYDEHHPYPDALDIEEFFNERFKGIHMTQSNYEIIMESFDHNSPWITGDFINPKKSDPTEG
jgi:tetratricopeptide (TPR) repeat protein